MKLRGNRGSSSKSELPNGGTLKKINGKTKTKKGKKKNKKLKKQKAKNSHVVNIKSYYVVPWRNSSDWDEVCSLFNNRDYEQVVRELRMWKERVPSLPIGVESSLFCLEAIIVDQKGQCDDEAKSLYSLALVRYLNHISHLATKEMGENAPVPLSQLVSHLSVPDWIVELRHEISHGINLPSLEILRYAAEFIMTWLTDNYWVNTENKDDQPGIELLSNKSANRETKEEKYFKMCNAASSFIASKIYQLRKIKGITDADITQALPNQPHSVKSKIAIGFFKTQIANLFTADPLLLCTALANEMIPNDEFINDFSSVLDISMDTEGKDGERLIFDKYRSLWSPIIQLIQTRGKVPQMCSILSQIHIREEETTKIIKLFSALWLDHFLQLLEQEEKVYPHRLKSILYSVITNPNEFTDIFLPRLLSLLEGLLGNNKIRQLETLYNIWSLEEKPMREEVYQIGKLSADLFTIENIMGTDQDGETSNPFKPQFFSALKSNQQQQNQPKANWDVDSRDSHFWRSITLGGTV